MIVIAQSDSSLRLGLPGQPLQCFLLFTLSVVREESVSLEPLHTAFPIVTRSEKVIMMLLTVSRLSSLGLGKQAPITKNARVS